VIVQNYTEEARTWFLNVSQQLDVHYRNEHPQVRGWFRNCAVHSTAVKSTYIQFSYMKVLLS